MSQLNIAGSRGPGVASPGFFFNSKVLWCHFLQSEEGFVIIFPNFRIMDFYMNFEWLKLTKTRLLQADVCVLKEFDS